jgi:hypothetical protein
MTNNQTQDTTTAAEVIEDSFAGVTEYVIAALAKAGYTIAGPGQAVVDQDRWERVVHHADLAFAHFPVLQDAGVFPDRDKRLEPGDLDPLPTQEGE